MTLKPWKSMRKTLMDNKAMLDFMADGAGVERTEFLNKIGPEPKPRAPAKPRARGDDPTSESDVNADIREAAKKHRTLRLYRNNRGVALLSNGGRLRYGVGPNGASDWIGYKSVVITPAMVGTEVAIFVAIEAKRPGEKGRPEQLAFLTDVLDAGGIAGIAHSAQELDALVGWPIEGREP